MANWGQKGVVMLMLIAPIGVRPLVNFRKFKRSDFKVPESSNESLKTGLRGMETPAHVEDVIQQVARTERLAEELLTSKHQVGLLKRERSDPSHLRPRLPQCSWAG